MRLIDFFWDLRGYFFFGAVLFLSGVVITVASRRAGPESFKAARWFSFPLLGCGGCLLIYPLIAVMGVVVFGVGAMYLCANTQGC